MPKETTSDSSAPAAAPAACSPTAWQLASLSTVAGTPESVRQQLRERDVAQLAQVGTHVQGAGPIDETRDPHADGPGTRTEGTRQPHQDVDEACASVRGGDTVLGDDRARVPWIDGHTEHLGAAHVQPHR